MRHQSFTGPYPPASLRTKATTVRLWWITNVQAGLQEGSPATEAEDQEHTPLWRPQPVRGGARWGFVGGSCAWWACGMNGEEAGVHEELRRAVVFLSMLWLIRRHAARPAGLRSHSRIHRKQRLAFFYDGNFSLMCVSLFFSAIVSCEKRGRFSFWAIHMLYKVYISECSLGYCLACCGFWIQETANSVRQCFGCFSALGEKGPWQQNIVCLLYALRSPTRKPTFTLKACVLIHRWMNEQH